MLVLNSAKYRWGPHKSPHTAELDVTRKEVLNEQVFCFLVPGAGLEPARPFRVNGF